MKNVIKNVKDFFNQKLDLINIETKSTYFPNKRYTLIISEENDSIFEKLEEMLSKHKDAGILISYKINKEVEKDAEKILKIYKDPVIVNATEEFMEDFEKMRITYSILLDFERKSD